MPETTSPVPQGGEVVRLVLIALLLSACGQGNRDPRPPASPASDSVPVVPVEPRIGVNIQPPTREQAPLVLAQLRELKPVRVRASWWAWSRAEDWSWCAEWRQSGISILPLIYPESGDPEQWGESAAARYLELREVCGPLPYVQVGNEVDGAGPYGIEGLNAEGARRQGHRWADELGEARKLIRDVDPETQVVSAGLAWVHTHTEDFLRGMVDVGGFDVLAVHVYGIGCAGEPLSRHAAVRNAGWTGPLWVTEMGTDDSQAAFAHQDPDSFQREQIEACLSKDAGRLGWDEILWFQLSYSPAGWGLVREDDSVRPAYEWMRDRNLLTK